MQLGNPLDAIAVIKMLFYNGPRLLKVLFGFDLFLTGSTCHRLALRTTARLRRNQLKTLVVLDQPKFIARNMWKGGLTMTTPNRAKLA
jgi:hypothetical protein